ncbi:MAG TPA: IPT/TIG domain-containing protein [Acidobacteriaceae bacterium]|nr:IPT/TIG domain-containing protein [Acidobacteriaceae bacterium]
MRLNPDPWIARIAALLIALALLLVFAGQASASGPRWVAGSSYFNPSAEGSPIVWANGLVIYYTDLSPLSSKVTQAQANTMVANAVAVWNGVNTAAISIQRGGNLAEDVDNSITTGSNGIVLPADIQPTATNKPVAVVYDENGSVINGIYGAGASSSLDCENNGVIPTVDNFAVTGNLAHALILVNGQCATTTAQITNIQYQLIRAFGYVLGLGWSQTNEEMFVNDQITSAGLAGWPILHPIERLCNGSGGVCMPNPTQLRTDDLASLSRLYPVTSANIGNFTGKTLTAAATISVTGTISFPLGQGMQGVNVVLRPLVNGVPDIVHTVTGVSGVYFQGNAGNPVTGSTDANGNPLTRFGSNDVALEGYFDLSDVPLPPGVTTSDYQLTFEQVNPLYIGNSAVAPYTTGQVAPSGTMPVITLPGLSAGSTVSQNVVIQDAADEPPETADGSFSAPVTVPVGGEWTARINGYGHSAWFQWWASGAREFTIEAQALDETGADTENKAQIVLGAWNGTDQAGAAPVTGTLQPLNGNVPGLSTLPVMTIADSEVRIGLADFRGDGRPDYAYRGRILYADSVTPARLPPSGGQIVIQGMGFRPTVTVTVNGVPAQVLSVTPNTIVATAPPSNGVTGNVLLQVQDSQTLGVTAIADNFSYDAQGNDAISIVTAPSGAVPIGVPQPLTVRAIDLATQKPAAGDTVTFSVTEGTAALGCGLATCSVVTAGDGTATLPVTANSAALAQLTASLTNGSSVLAEFTGTAPPSIVALTPNLYLVLGATAQWPVQALALNAAGTAVQGQSITWSPNSPNLAVAASQCSSGAAGIASDQIAAGPFTASVASTVSACLTGSMTCANFTVTPVDPETAALVAWTGTEQYIPASQTFTPVVLHVTDAFGDPLAGAGVTIAETLYGWTEPCPNQGSCAPAPILAQQTVQAASALDGSVTFTPLSANGLAARLIVIASAGAASILNFELDAHP